MPSSDTIEDGNFNVLNSNNNQISNDQCMRKQYNHETY